MVKTGMGRRTAFMGFSAILLAGCAAAGMPTAAPAGNAVTGAQAAFGAALRGYEQENLKPLEALLPAQFTVRWDKRFLRLPGLVPGVETGSWGNGRSNPFHPTIPFPDSCSQTFSRQA